MSKPEAGPVCGLCGHSLKDNAHGFDQNDGDTDSDGNFKHSGCCTYCIECRKAELAAVRNTPDLREALEQIREVACGEQQVADDDAGGMAWIYGRALEALAAARNTLKFDLEDILAALAYASEGRTNSVKPDLLGNFLNRRLSAWQSEAAARNTPEIARELRNIAKAIEVGWDSSNWRRPQIPAELRIIASKLEAGR